MTRSILLLAFLFLAAATPAQAKHASPACQDCKANAVQACQQLATQEGWKKKKLKSCIEKGKKNCKPICKGKAMPTKPAQTPTEDKLEDQPCFNYCSTTQCGGGTKEAHDACILDCIQSTNCMPH
jgi:hypothetical protein